MTRVTDAVRSASAPRDWKDAVSAIRRQHGSGAARVLADATGAHVDTARRWIATAEGRGTQQPSAHVAGRMQSIEDAADEGWLVADALATAQMIDAGQVEVFYGGRSQGYRRVGTLTVDEEMAFKLEQAGLLFAQGNNEEAEQILSDAILGGYSRERVGDNRNILAGTLKVGDFRSGFRIV